MIPLQILVGVVQGVCLVLLAPLAYGIQRKIIARLQLRKGPPVIQPYRDLLKLWSKDKLSVPEVSSWIYMATPLLYLAITVVIAMSIPVFVNMGIPLADIFLLIYSLALARFVLSIASLDTGSPLAAAGAWRENAAAVVIEVPMLFAALLPALEGGSSSLYAVVSHTCLRWETFIARPSYIVAALAFFVCMLAEAGVLPFDVAEAEQEIQEGLLQEYSGRQLALMQLSMMVKRAVLFTLFVDIFLPYGVALTLEPLGILVGVASYLIKLLALVTIAALVIAGNARYKVVELHKNLSLVFVLVVCATIFYLMGW
ncbi:respiratory chain complex I subunit 1 family protein [Thermofilum pendens]|uniref:Respiratory-chain NADH dehydrogenase, subunit 1 n=1 Tax=Thermofilum pendens (strain DSM 2475 / Hrk 5) TaxID=368408 RepID=A1RWL7_THEPD|nr:NADH-quinone oxidoreductase subunit H [Thermofilum pendens]ABL77597.1 respiratory-chain NADH dehydrogenase, subunit 1 [Thermofilum pendens Hrk 5]